MEDSPLPYIQNALRRVSLSDKDITVTNYSPKVFGNLVAVARTKVGELRIVYDRGFFVDASRPVDDWLVAELIAALEQERSAFYGASDCRNGGKGNR